MGITVLVVDDEANARENIHDFLTPMGYEVIGAATLAEARENLGRGIGDVIVLDVMLGDGYGPDLLYETASIPARPPIILITAFPSIEMAVDAMKSGAHDFLSKPFDLVQLEKSIKRAFEIVTMRRELTLYRQSQQNTNDFIVGSTPLMHTLLEQAQRAALSSASVLITGETGTGKEVLARYIHKSGPRADKPYIAVNSGAIQNTMMESELFGYEAGAFTGAEKRKHGLMEVADGGILFLDEIASMPLDMQVKLLRALEERAFRRVGGTTLISVDVQLLAASNRDLSALIQEGKFREDLYYRLKVVDLHTPALRDRKIDIPELVGFFVRNHAARQGKNIDDVSPRVMQALTNYDWPGNIRELSNTIERATIFCDGGTIDLPDLPTDIAKCIQE